MATFSQPHGGARNWGLLPNCHLYNGDDMG